MNREYASLLFAASLIWSGCNTHRNGGANVPLPLARTPTRSDEKERLYRLVLIQRLEQRREEKADLSEDETFVLGALYFFGEEYQKAIDVYKGILGKQPNDAKGMLKVASCHGMLHMWAEKKGMLSRAYAADPTDPWPSFWLGEYARTEGSKRALYEEALEKDPHMPYAYLGLAALHSRDGAPAKTKALHYMSDYLRHIDYELAPPALFAMHGYLTKVLCLEEIGRIWERLSEERMHKRQLSEEERQYKRALIQRLGQLGEEKADLSEDEMFVLGALYFFGEEYQKAIDVYEVILEKQPNDAKAMLKVASCYAVTGRSYEESRRLLARAHNADFTDPWPLFRTAELGRETEGIIRTLYEEALKRDPHMPYPHLGLAALAYSMGGTAAKAEVLHYVSDYLRHIDYELRPPSLRAMHVYLVNVLCPEEMPRIRERLSED